MTDAKKIAEIHARTRPGAAAREGDAAPAQEWDDHSLPLGSRVGEFEITEIIGKGGFGIVYLAWDHSLDRVVALKEYMPASFASRQNRTQVHPLSERHRDTFQIGLNSFVNEAKLLAQFHNPSLVEVHRFWEANGTAYMVMPYYRGKTLGETVRALAGPPSQAWLLELLGPVTEALLELHSVQCYHRDVAPDNILILTDSGAPLLLDFGAARRVIAGQEHALTVILKGGYAPLEQYGDVPGMEQGAWTDVYALASVVYWAVMGKTPPPAPGRMIRDTYVPLVECAPPQYSREFAAAIDRALVVMPEQRTASLTALRAELGLPPVGGRATTTMRWSDPDATVLVAPTVRRPAPTTPAVTRHDPADDATTLAPPRTVAHAATAGHPAQAAPVGHTVQAATVGRPAPASPVPTQPGAASHATPPAAPRSRVPMLAAAGGAALLIAGAGAGVWWLQSQNQAGPPTPDLTAPVASQPAPVPVAPAAQSIPLPRSAADALALIQSRQDAAMGVSADVGAPARQGGAARRAVAYRSALSGHLYLIGVHADSNELRLLLPGVGSQPALTGTTGTLDLPVEALKTGAWKFALIVAREPLDLAAHGWTADDKTWKRTFPAADDAALPWAIPACPAALQNCAAGYGATVFDVKIDAPPKIDATPKINAPKIDPVRPPAAKPAVAARNNEPAQAAQPKPKVQKAAANPECEKILMRMSLGEAGQDLIDRMKSLKCS